MSQQDTVSIRILDKEYQVNCPPNERDALVQSASHLDARMRTIRNSGTVIGLERIAVMAALNLTYDLDKTESNVTLQKDARKQLDRIDKKLTLALKSLEKSVTF